MCPRLWISRADMSGFILVVTVFPPTLLVVTVTADLLGWADVAPGAIMAAAGFNMDSDIGAADLFADLFLYIISDIVRLFDGEVLADGEVKVDQFLRAGPARAQVVVAEEFVFVIVDQ